MFEVEEHGRDGNDRTDDSQQGCQSQRDGTQGCSPGPGSHTPKGAPTSGSSPPTPTSSATPSAPSWSLVTEPNDGMQPIYSLMSSARDTLDMTMYELADPTTVSILEADARRGVRVRVLLDQDYSGYSINEPDFSQLASNGVQVRWAPAGTIFHQKTITVDDRTSAIMTLNLTSEYYSTTRDFAVITTDQPDVAAIEQVFDADWTNSGAPATGPTGQNLVWSPGAEAAIVSLIDSAQHSLLVENEEMDDPDVTNALESAAQRGVDVDVVMTYSSSWPDAFDDLTSAGVHVRTYSPDASLYIHAKVVVADEAKLFLGSQNFSASSLDYNRELGIITTDTSLVGPVVQDSGVRLRRGHSLHGTDTPPHPPNERLRQRQPRALGAGPAPHRQTMATAVTTTSTSHRTSRTRRRPLPTPLTNGPTRPTALETSSSGFTTPAQANRSQLRSAELLARLRPNPALLPPLIAPEKVRDRRA